MLSAPNPNQTPCARAFGGRQMSLTSLYIPSTCLKPRRTLARVPLRRIVEAFSNSDNKGRSPSSRPHSASSLERKYTTHNRITNDLNTGLPSRTSDEEDASGSGSSGDEGERSRRASDDYDFFGRTLPRSPLREKTRSVASSTTQQSAPLRPSFRVSPLLAEFQRQQQRSSAAKVLVLDEGGEFRATLAVALLRHMLSRTRARLDVEIDVASLGPPTDRVGWSAPLQSLARGMGVALPPPEVQCRRFEDVADPVRYDLILVMDRFDLQEVMRDVTVLDTINPGGQYAGRVRLLGPFGMNNKRAAPIDVPKDVSDPLYEAQGGEEAEDAAMRGAARDLAFSCRGVVSYLLALQSRCKDGVTLQEALVQSLQCPLLLGEIPTRRQPPSKKNEAQQLHSDNMFTVRMVAGRRMVVRRPGRPRGYWKDPANVDAELTTWMKARSADRLPTQQELRNSGFSSLATAVDAHGGLAVFSTRLKIGLAARRPNGYWDNFDTLARALTPYLKVKIDATVIGGDCAVLPTQQQLLDAGRADLLRAIRRHGGSTAVARRMRVGVRRGGGWTEEELAQQLITVTGGVHSRRELLGKGNTTLVSAVDRLGGFPYFQQQLGSPIPPAGPKASMIERAAAKVEEWMAATHPQSLKRGARQRMPTRDELSSSDRSDVWVAIQRSGGVRRVAEHLGIEWEEMRGRRRRGDGDDSGSGSDSSSAPDPREEIDLLEAEEEVVFV